MIARNFECDPKQLRSALADRLSDEQQDRLSAHLDDCQHCRNELERLAGDRQWWDDTREMLHEVADADTGLLPHPALGSNPGDFSLGGHPDLGASRGNAAAGISSTIDGSWVLPLLDQPAASGDASRVLGLLDGIPITDIIGQGGMGVVLKGHDKALNREVAVKLLSPMLASTGAARLRFFREAQAAAAIVHPNIVPIYAISADRSLPYLVMPFVGGGNLQQVVDRDGPLDLMRVLTIGLQVAEGLSAAHRQGIVHRDIKPANLMLDDGGFRVMITDFGLARALDDATLTGSGMLAGTPQYMSPEQACGQGLDHRSDIYSLGAVLYTLATGWPPVRGSSTLEILRKIGEQPPRPVADLNESYPLWFMSLLERLMAKSREQRVASADEAAQLIRECLSHARSPMQVDLPHSLRHNSSGASGLRATGGKAWTSRIVSAVVALVTVLALGVFGFAVWQAKPSRSRVDPSVRQDSSARQSTSVNADAALQAEPNSETVPTAASDNEWPARAIEQRLRDLENQTEQLLRELGR